VQVDPFKPKLKAPGTKRLKLNCVDLLINFGFKCDLRRYIKVTELEAEVCELGKSLAAAEATKSELRTSLAAAEANAAIAAEEAWSEVIEAKAAAASSSGDLEAKVTELGCEVTRLSAALAAAEAGPYTRPLFSST
jgi:hypothetical protein